jgi:hypothetical protein
LITNAWGDVNWLDSTLLGGFEIRYRSTPDCTRCRECPVGVPYVCQTESVAISLSFGGSVVDNLHLAPVQTGALYHENWEITMTFVEGETLAHPQCTDHWECVGAFLSSVFTLHVARVRQDFIRGEANTDNRLDIADAVFALSYLFVEGPTPLCFDAADANDDGTVDINDGVYILQNLFGNGPDIPPPYPRCGIDPTADQLRCLEYSHCK